MVPAKLKDKSMNGDLVLKKIILIIILLNIFSCSGQSSPKISEVNTSYQKVLNKTKENNKKILLMFGADWCGDCKAMKSMLKEKEIQTILESDYEFMEIDVGRFDKNLDFAEKFQNPIAKGIPAFVIIDKNEKILISTNNGMFSKARKMKSEAVKEFLLKYL